MKMDNACYPCLVRNALDVAGLATKDPAVQRRILIETMTHLSGADPGSPPPLIARFIQETTAGLTGVPDPYRGLKQRYNAMALELYPKLKALKQCASDRFDAAVRLSVAGNIIDFGVASAVGRDTLLATIAHAMDTRVRGRIEMLKQAVDRAGHILWIGDNAGEIVFDRLLLAEMDCRKIVYAVRGAPVQNDATREDAAAAGLDKIVRVVDSGAAIPGTLIGHCSPEFVREFNRADLVISKGQGNFETLDHDDPRIFFLFKAKCPVVAGCGGWDLGDVVVKACGTGTETDPEQIPE